MELLHEPRMARKISMLDDCQQEVLVLTSRTLLEGWEPGLNESLRNCAARGLRVKVLVEKRGFSHFPSPTSLRESGVEVRESTKRFSWMWNPYPVQGELWIFDRGALIAANERLSGAPSALAVECLLGPDAALGTAAYFDHRWESASAAINFSVRQKNYAFYSGQRARNEFFACLLTAQEEITLSLPGGRISRKVALALHSALAEGLKVTIFANAEGDNAPALRRLRRLAGAGALVKICGRRLKSECALVDGNSIYMGSFPSSWQPWPREVSPVFVLQDRHVSHEILEALEKQVSVEINGERASNFYAYR